MTDINFNIACLKTVYNPLNISLDNAIKNIEENIGLVKANNVKAASLLKITASEYIHEAETVLKMIGLDGLNVVLFQAQEVLNLLKTEKTNRNLANSLQNILNLLIDTKKYIVNLYNGGLDNPSQFITHYKTLALELNKTNVSSYDLFFPKIDLLREENGGIDAYYKLDTYNEDKLNKVKREFIIAFNNLKENIKKLNNDGDLKEVINDIISLKELKINKHIHILLIIIKAYFSCLKEGKIDISEKIDFIHNIEKNIGLVYDLVQESNTTNIKKIRSDKEFQKNMVYKLIFEIHNHKVLNKVFDVVELNKIFNLNSYLDQLESKTEIKEFEKVDEKINENLIKEFDKVKGLFERFVEKNVISPDLMNKLDDVFVLLNKVEWKEPATIIRLIKKILVTIQEKNQNEEENTVIKVKEEIAFVLNIVESIIRNTKEKYIDNDKSILSIVNRLTAINDDENTLIVSFNYVFPDFIKEQEYLNSKSSAYTQLIKELDEFDKRINIIVNKEISFDDDDEEDNQKVLNILERLRGVLHLTGKADLAKLVESSLVVFNKLIQEDISAVNKEELDKSTQNIAAIYLYVKEYTNKNLSEALNIYYDIINKNESLLEEAKENVVIDIKEYVEEVVEKEEDILTPVMEPVINKYEDVSNSEELCDIFLMEVEEIFTNLKEDLIQIKNNKQNIDLFKSIRRYHHTLKGSARMIGFANFAEGPWIIEQTLNVMLDTGEYPDDELINVLEKTTDILSGEINEFITNGKTVLISQPELIKNLILPLNPKARFSFDLNKEIENTTTVKKSVDEIFKDEVTNILDKIKDKSLKSNFFILDDDGVVILKHLLQLSVVSKYEKVEKIINGLLSINFKGNVDFIRNNYPINKSLEMINDIKNNKKIKEVDFKNLISLLNKNIVDENVIEDVVIPKEKVEPIEVKEVKKPVIEEKEVIEVKNNEVNKENEDIMNKNILMLMDMVGNLTKRVDDLNEQNQKLLLIINNKNNEENNFELSSVMVKLEELEASLNMMKEDNESETKLLDRVDDLSGYIKNIKLENDNKELFNKMDKDFSHLKEDLKNYVHEEIENSQNEMKNYVKKIVLNSLNAIKADLAKKKGVFFN